MRIGVDLDMTLVDFIPVYRQAFEKLGVKYVRPRTWDMREYPKEVREQIIKNFSDENIMCNLEPYPWSKSFIDNERSKGHKIFIVTARSHLMDNIGFIKSMFDCDDIIITIPGSSKLIELKALGIDLWIDDCPHQCIETYEAGIPTIMIQNENTLYNYHIKHLNTVENISMIKGIKTWITGIKL